MYTYQQALGELGSDNYDDSYAPSVFWLIFLMSSMFLQIILLNLLIAIMGDTFDRVLEVSREAQTKEICFFINEYDFLVDEREIIESRAIFQARLEDDEDDGADNWDGRVGVLKVFFKKQITAIKDEVKEKINRVSKNIKELKKGFIEQKKQMK